VLSVLAELPLALGPRWLDPDFLIKTFGLAGILAIVFVESGLLVGFFLPGDALLFTAGLLSSTGKLPALEILLVTIPIAAIAGDQVGYMIGRKSGPAVFNKPDGRLFRRTHVDKTREYFEHYGPRTVLIARFVPIVRTFVPIMAGVGQMRYRTFVTYNVLGGIGWGIGVTTLGYYLGRVDFVRANVELIIVGVVLLSWIPIVIELTRARRRVRAAPAQLPADQRAS
jgi:membrane-associated protein